MGRPVKEFVCIPCKRGFCEDCADIHRVAYSLPRTCKCRRPEHNGEPRDRQILDPESGTVYAPGLKVAEDGNVTYEGDDDA